MARQGMTTLIRRLRALAAVGTSDYTLNGVTYWTDDQLQAALDAYAEPLNGLRLIPLREGASSATYTYLIPTGRHFEQWAADSGWAVRDVNGVSVSPERYAVNYEARRLTFAEDQAGARYTLDARAYNLSAAAADVWSQKAASAAARVDWSADGRGTQAGQEYAHCLTMAAHFAALAGVRVGRFVRADMAGG